MEELMRNKGLVHLAEGIFDFLSGDDLVQFLAVSETCNQFVNHYGWKLMLKKLETVLKRKDYKCKYYHISSSMSVNYSTLKQCYPVWMQICDYFKAQKSLPQLNLLVTKLDEYGQLRRKLDPRWQNYNVLQMMVKLGDHKFVQLILECRVVDFTGTFLNLCMEVDCFEILNDVTLKNQCKVIDILLRNSKSAGIDINAINTFNSTQPLLHEIVVKGRPEILKFLIENSQRYDINLNMPFFQGTSIRNPFDALINSNSSAMYQKLNCWLKFPSLFNAEIFKKMSIFCLLTIMTHISKEMGNSDNPYLKFHVEDKEILEDRVWTFYKNKIAKIGNEPPNKRKKLL